MNTSQHLSILTMMGMLGAPLAVQAQTVGGAALGAAPDKRGQTFKRTQSGDWETTIVRPDSMRNFRGPPRSRRSSCRLSRP